MKSINIITALALLFASIPLKADDVYNFYFQKAPGPTTVIQGGGKAGKDESGSAVATTVKPSTDTLHEEPSQEVSTAQPVTTPIEARPEFKKWAIMGGIAEVKTEFELRQGWSVGFEYYFNKQLGADLHFTATTIDKDSFEFGPSRGQREDYSAGVMYTPILLNFFWADSLSLSGLAGLISAPGNTCRAYYCDEKAEAERKMEPYLGAGVSFNFLKNVSLVTQVRRASQDNSQAKAALAFRF